MDSLCHGKSHLEMDDDWGYPYSRFKETSIFQGCFDLSERLEKMMKLTKAQRPTGFLRHLRCEIVDADWRRLLQRLVIPWPSSACSMPWTIQLVSEMQTCQPRTDMNRQTLEKPWLLSHRKASAGA